MEVKHSSASQLFQLQEQIRESRQNHATLDERIGRLQEEKDLLEARKNRKKSAGSLDISKANKEILVLRESHHSLSNRKEELEGDYKTVADFFAKLKSQLNGLQTEEVRLQVQLNVIKTSIDERRATNADMKKKCVDLSQRLEDCKRQTFLLEKNAGREKLKNEKLVKIMEETKQKCDTLEAKKQRTLDRTQELSQQIRNHREEITHRHRERKSTVRLLKTRQVDLNHIRVKVTNTRRQN